MFISAFIKQNYLITYLSLIKFLSQLFNNENSCFEDYDKNFVVKCKISTENSYEQAS